MVLPIRPQYSNPIPNNPFYSAETFYIQGSLGPLILGAGLSVNYISGTLDATGGGGGGVTNLTAGPGITLIPNPIVSSGVVSLSPVGTAGTVSHPSSLAVNAYGQITSYTSGTTPVDTLVGTAPIVVTGAGSSRTISLGNSGVAAGSYAYSTITVSAQGIITSAVAGVAPVTAVTATAPLASSGGLTPDISLTSSGVTAGSYTNSSITVNSLGIVTAASSGAPAVTAVTASSPLTSSGGLTPDIGLSNSGVTAGSYTLANVTVDAYGRVTSASDGVLPPKVSTVTGTAPITVDNTDPLNPVVEADVATSASTGVVSVGTNISVDAAGQISVATASTTGAGVVQLNNTTSSPDATLALTAAQGKNLQDQITALASSSANTTFSGTLNGSTGNMVAETAAGLLAGFTTGSPLPAPAPALADYYVVVDTPGTFTPPGGTPITVAQGDWVLCDGSSWVLLSLGFVAPSATTTSAGIVELADSAETASGTDGTLAVTPLGLASAYIPQTQADSVGELIVGGAGSPLTLAAPTDGQVLYGDTGAAGGVSWQTPNYLNNCFTAPSVGQLITGTGTGGSDSYAALALGANGNILVACSACTNGMFWSNALTGYIPASTMTAPGELIVGTGAGSYTTLSASVTDGQVLTVDTANPNRLIWTTPDTDFVPCSAYTAVGDIVFGTGAGTFSALPASTTNGQVLTIDTANANKLVWCTPSADIPCSLLTAKGDIVAASAANTPAALPVGADGEFLVADSSAASGLAWAASAVAPATPTVEGIVLGCTDATNTALGCNALAVNVGGANVAIGASAMEQNNTGVANVAVGYLALCSNDGGVSNVAVGPQALQANTVGDFNVAVGRLALQQSATGINNTAIGYSAGCNITTGSCNVAIGYGVTVDSPIDDCQLAIGFAPNQNWITGDCDKNIRPGAGIIDCTGNTGSAGQVLTSTGTAIQWAAPGSNIIASGYVGCRVDVIAGPFMFFYNSTSPSNQWMFRSADTSTKCLLVSTLSWGLNMLAGGGRQYYTLPSCTGSRCYMSTGPTTANYSCYRTLYDGDWLRATIRVGPPATPEAVYCFVSQIGYGSGTICGYACNFYLLCQIS